MTEYRKLNKRGPMKSLKTSKQLETSKREGNRAAISGRLDSYKFQKGHVPHNAGKERPKEVKDKISKTMLERIAHGKIKFESQSKPKSESQKIKQSMKMYGRKGNEKSRAYLIRQAVFNHNMKNPETAKKNGIARMKKFEPEIKEKIISDFNSGKSIKLIAKENKTEPETISKFLRFNGINFDAKERIKMNSKSNPNIQKNWFKPKNVLLIFILFLSISQVCAFGAVGENGINVNIVNDTILVRGYTVVANPSGGISQALSDTLFINKLFGSINSGVTCNNNTGSYYASLNADLPFLGFNVSNQSQLQFVDTVTQSKLDACNLDKNTCTNQYNSLYSDYSKINDTQKNYIQCITDLANAKAQKTSSDDKVTSLQKQIDDSKNTPVAWGIGGLILGAGAALFFTGKLGGAKVKHPDESYNRQQGA